MEMTTEALATTCRDDGEFRQAVRHWTGGFRLAIGDQLTGLTVRDGEIAVDVPEPGDDIIELSGPADVWEPLLKAVPPPLANTVAVMVRRGLQLNADPLTWWQYLPATERLIELMRPTASNVEVDETAPVGTHDAPTGHYVHVELDGQDHRIYYEEAGSGIPLLLQHTAGAHGVQWRHLFENPDITDRFRLIAYDLPFHGKSIPPVGPDWWHEPYRLTGDFVRQLPVALTTALNLDNPVFMGCSVGGLLALDLALHHPDVFDAVISLEGALHIGGDYDSLFGMWHPEVSAHSKARMMEGLCAPTSPESYIKEVSMVYASGWPPAFLGDLWYYTVDYDIRDRAHEIDTTKCAVHILNGEYDYTGTIAKGITAHEAIAGSTHTAMDNIGHFPMTENPELFMSYLAPVLHRIRHNA